MATETMDAEKMRRMPFKQLIGTCSECGEPVTAGQEFHRTDSGVEHALCFYEPNFAKRVRAEHVPKLAG